MTLRYHTPLTPEEQRAFGLETPQTLAMADRVRFAELDVQNHVNNKSYLTWFESLRIAYLARHTDPFFAGQALPRVVLRSAEIRFIREMLMDEDYVTTAQVTAFRTSSFTVRQELWSGSLRATLSGVVVMLQPDGSGRYPLPQALRDWFRNAEGATEEG